MVGRGRAELLSDGGEIIAAAEFEEALVGGRVGDGPLPQFADTVQVYRDNIQSDGDRNGDADHLENRLVATLQPDADNRGGGAAVARGWGGGRRGADSHRHLENAALIRPHG